MADLTSLVGTSSSVNCSNSDGAEVEIEVLSVVRDPSLVNDLVFRSPSDADRWLIEYGEQLGFDWRKYSRKKSKKKQVVKSCIWVCNRHGFREPDKPGKYWVRRPTPETRCRCRVRFRIALKTNGLYRVTGFYPFHNHELLTGENRKHLKCRRYMRPVHKALLSGMVSSGIRQCDAMDYLEELEGGLGSLPFKRKDGYNLIAKERYELIRDGDINTVLALLEGMRLQDKDLVFYYTFDGDNMLTRLFWNDGISRAEFEVFGDVLVFDSTYKTNTYNYPLVIFSGVNNHFHTCVFGAAFLFNESLESYCWVLQRFREAMGGKTPKSVLTDQDASMRAAIIAEFPNARHRICSLHLQRNALNRTRLPESLVSLVIY